jgi:hypothetical protein
VSPEWQAIVGLAAFIQMGIIAVARWFLVDRDKQIAYRDKQIAERDARIAKMEGKAEEQNDLIRRQAEAMQKQMDAQATLIAQQQQMNIALQALSKGNGA